MAHPLEEAAHAEVKVLFLVVFGHVLTGVGQESSDDQCCQLL